MVKIYYSCLLVMLLFLPAHAQIDEDDLDTEIPGMETPDIHYHTDISLIFHGRIGDLWINDTPYQALTSHIYGDHDFATIVPARIIDYHTGSSWRPNPILTACDIEEYVRYHPQPVNLRSWRNHMVWLSRKRSLSVKMNFDAAKAQWEQE